MSHCKSIRYTDDGPDGKTNKILFLNNNEHLYTIKRLFFINNEPNIDALY